MPAKTLDQLEEEFRARGFDTHREDDALSLSHSPDPPSPWLTEQLLQHQEAVTRAERRERRRALLIALFGWIAGVGIALALELRSGSPQQISQLLFPVLATLTVAALAFYLGSRRR